MKIKFELEIDTELHEDKHLLQQFMEYLQQMQDTFYDDEQSGVRG